MGDSSARVLGVGRVAALCNVYCRITKMLKEKKSNLTNGFTVFPTARGEGILWCARFLSSFG